MERMLRPPFVSILLSLSIFAGEHIDNVTGFFIPLSSLSSSYCGHGASSSSSLLFPAVGRTRQYQPVPPPLSQSMASSSTSNDDGVLVSISESKAAVSTPPTETTLSKAPSLNGKIVLPVKVMAAGLKGHTVPAVYAILNSNYKRGG